MAINHGNKVFSSPLDPHRSQLLEEVAASQGVRATALMGSAVRVGGTDIRRGGFEHALSTTSCFGSKLFRSA